MGAHPQAARARVLRPQRALGGRRGLHQLSRPDRPDGGRAPGPAAQHELVSRLSPRPGQVHPPEGPGHEHGLGALDRPSGAHGSRANSQSATALLGVSPMSKRKPYQFSKPAADGKVFWTSLEAKADPAAHQKRAQSEFIDGVSGSDLVSGKADADSP